MFQSVPTAPGELQISEKMANAITGWLLAFYQRPAWLEAGYRVTNAPINVTDYMSTLACNEIAMSAGASARGTWINDQLTRFLLPQLKNAVQLAGAGGRVVVKPYPSGRNIYCEIIPADRIYPTRINGAGVTEAGFFTDFAALRGRKVVRVEAWDLQPDGLYLQNRAYWYNTGDTLGGELALTDVPEWAGLEPEVVIRGVDRPLFGELRMPMANTVDETSKLPVSLYARAVDTMAELDRIYSEFLWEIHTGKRKRIVDRTAIKPDKSGGGVPFRDQTTDLYLSMDLTGDMGQGDPFRDYTPALRVEEYRHHIGQVRGADQRGTLLRQAGKQALCLALQRGTGQENPHRRGKDLLLRKHLRRKRGEIRRMDTKGYCSRPVLRRQHQGATASIQHPLDWGAHLWRCGHHGRQAHLYPWIVCVGGITYGQPEHRREGGASVYRQRRESSH